MKKSSYFDILDTFCGKPNPAVERWIKTHEPIPPGPEPTKQFNFLYKREEDTEWQEYVPTENDIQLLVGDKVTIIATDFKQMDGFVDVREVKLPNKWNNNGTYIDVTSIGDSAFWGCTGLTSVMIPDSVTRIGYMAFNGCESLYNVDIGNSVTHIEQGAFAQTRISSITFPASLEYIDDGIFYFCNYLTNIFVDPSNPNFKSQNGLLLSKDGKILYEGVNGNYVYIPDGVEQIRPMAFGERMNLTNVRMPSTLKTIGSYAFEWCGFTQIEIPNSVTSIGDGAFSYCSGLTSVTIPNSVTSIGSSAFYSCTGLTSVTIPDGVTSIGEEAFSGCMNVTDVVVPGWKCNIPFDAVTNLVISDGTMIIQDEAFSDCSGLTSVTIPDSVTNIGDQAFRDCSGLVSVIIPDSVISIGHSVFYNCNSLQSITFSDNITAIVAYTCQNCTSLANVHLPAKLITIAQSSFIGCTSLEQIEIPQSVNNLRNNAFQGCTSLHTVIFAGDEPTNIGTNMFQNVASGCKAIVDCTLTRWSQIPDGSRWNNLIIEYKPVPDGMVRYKTSDGSWHEEAAIIENSEFFGFADKANAVEVIIPSKDENGNDITSIAEGAFVFCTSLVSVMIPNTIMSIGPNAFLECISLTSVEIPDSVESIGSSAFARCSELTSVTIVANDGDAEAVKAAMIAAGVDEDIEWIMPEPEPLPDGTGYTETVDGIEWTFKVVNGEAIVEKGIDQAAIPSETSGDIEVPKYLGGCKVTGIGDYAFTVCNNLTNVTIPNTATSIGTYAFQSCTGLTDVTIPNGMTQIGWASFAGCSSLTDVTIPDTVTNIESGAFYLCSGLTQVTFEGNAPSVGSGAFIAVASGCKAVIDPTKDGWPEDGSSWNGLIVAYRYYESTFIKYVGENDWNEYNVVGTLTENSIPNILNAKEVVVGTNVTKIDRWVFFNVDYGLGAPDLSRIVIPNTVKTIGSEMCAHCESLSCVSIANGPNAIQIYNGAFKYCTSLATVIIPNNISTIGSLAFCDCSNLTNLTVPDTITIENQAFVRCTRLTTVTIASNGGNAEAVKQALINSGATNVTTWNMPT